jgi:hypothetical protein
VAMTSRETLMPMRNRAIALMMDKRRRNWRQLEH